MRVDRITLALMDSQRTVWAALCASAERHADKVAIRDHVRSLTYAQLLREVEALCGGLRELCVGRGTVVAMMLGNHVEHATLWMATCSLGAIECSLNPELRGPLLVDVLRDSGAEILVIEAGYLAEIADVVADLPNVRSIILRPDGAGGDVYVPPLPPRIGIRNWGQLLSAAPADGIGDVDGSDVFGIIYTSGSSGKSKGVLVTHAQTYLRCEPGSLGTPCVDDVTLVALPMFHVVGLCRGVYSTLINGGTAVLVPRFSASQFWNQARRFGATCAPLLGSMAWFLSSQPRGEGDRNHGVRWVSMAPPIAGVDQFRARFGLEVYTSYGLTEAVALTSGRASGRGNGWLRSDFEMRLVDDLDREVGANAIGELVVRPKQPWTTMVGYHNDAAATQRMMLNLWLHTGDLFQVLDDGELQFIGRKGDRIRRRGENISASLIEERAAGHGLINSAFAMAVPDDQGVEDEILLCVVPSDEGLEPLQIHEYLSAAMPAFMVPRYILVLTEVPLMSSQKVDRVKLRKMARFAWDAVRGQVPVTYASEQR